MSNPISIDFNQDNDDFTKCLPSQSRATAITEQADHSNSSKAFSSLLFDLHNDDDEFDQLNQQMSKVLLDEPSRTSLIEAFQADMSSYLSHDKLTKNSRRMQSEYQQSTPKEKEYIFHTYIKNDVINISQDKYMHYILEKIIEVGPPSQRNFILDQIFPNINKLVKDLYACKVMQKGLEIMSQFPQESPSQFQLYLSFIHQDSSFMREVYVDKIANQIVQKSLEVLDGAPLLKLLKILSQYILKENPVQFELSTDQYGCLIVNKIIDIFPKQYDTNIKQITNEIITRAIDNSSCLVRRQYANYIVQQILEKGQEQHKRLLMDQYLIKDFVSMSMDKYGSNVAEKAIIYAGPKWRKRLWEEEVSVSESAFRKLVDDQFANYPIQRLFEYLEMEYRNEFIVLLKTLSESNFLNHHGQIVLKFALTNFNTRKYAQKVTQSDINKTTKFQEKNKQNSNFQQKQQQIDSRTQLLQYQFQMQQQPFMQYQQSPYDQQQYYAMMQMFYWQQIQQQYMYQMPQQQQQNFQFQQPFNLQQLQMQQPMNPEQVMMYQSQQQQCNQQRNQRNGQ